MDYQEAFEYMRKEAHRQTVNSEGQDAYIIAISAMLELQEYKKLGALEEVRDAVERQQAKKPVVGADVMVGRDDGGNPIWETDYVCAECGMGIAPEYVCCPYCETVIDWSEEI